jgi:hypothetical protein
MAAAVLLLFALVFRSAHEPASAAEVSTSV